MHFLITAGPTREYIDPVRFISNGSTGKMGYACATAAIRRGHKVTLVSGPVNLTKPKGVKLIKVTTSDEMAKAVRAVFDRCDCVIMTAAVCDYKPEKPANQKIKKTDQPFSLKLKRTIDILAELGRVKEEHLLIGFAVQDRSARQNARRKMSQKNLDVVVLNSPAAFGADRTDAQILPHGGSWEKFPNTRKNTLATAIVRLAERQYKEAAVKTDNT
ncbi:MAG: phosphopantothenoylcysteine decarboxylase [Sedimentisphaerales bacterium]|nr:phosphopantothenoylcysteine decarboxylase [Sedimentisphaerales bacterium]